MLVTLIISFNLGLFSTLHCVGMCGGILTTMMMASPDSDKNKNVFNKSLAYNIGRISSYSLAGLFSGLLGMQIIHSLQSFNGHLILQGIASLVLILLALNILDVLSIKKYSESIGMVLWKHIQPWGKKFYPVNSLWKAYILGMIWGWLPCGLVYSALLLSISTGTVLDGILTMFIFGLGTLPGMLSAGYFSGHLRKLASNRKVKIVTATLMILIAVSLPLSTVYFSQHSKHSGETHSIHHHN
jgi:uncharacterized protein